MVGYFKILDFQFLVCVQFPVIFAIFFKIICEYNDYIIKDYMRNAIHKKNCINFLIFL